MSVKLLDNKIKENLAEKDIKTSLAVVQAVREALIESLLEVVEEEGKFTMPKLGTFKLAERAARTARNPHTGGTVSVPAKTVLKFKPSSRL